MNLKDLLSKYTVDQLKEAIRLQSTYGRTQALEEKKATLLKQVAKIDRKLSKLNGNGSATKSSEPGRRPGRRKSWKLSAVTRRKMSEAAKRRYAGKGKAETTPLGKRKRRAMSPETRANMAASARARWAKVKSAQ